MSESVRIGGGAGFLSDRFDATLELVEHGALDAVILDGLAERTLALLHRQKKRGQVGYWKGLPNRLAEFVSICLRYGTTVITNAGGTAPREAALRTLEQLQSLGIAQSRVAAVMGDDVSDVLERLDPLILETGEPFSKLKGPVLGANAYIGAEAISEAYSAGADLIVTGRVADPALAVGPATAELGWRRDDLGAMACGVLAGHLLECGPQVTGGYFADPALKEVTDLDRLGFPIAEITRDLTLCIGMPDSSGGRIDRHTVLEQLLYEIQDPASYITPDVTLDLSKVEITEIANNRVRLSGARGKARPADLKVLVGTESGFMAEAEISYGGISAMSKGQLALEIVRKRLKRGRIVGVNEFQCNLIGVDSLWSTDACAEHLPCEVRARFAARVDTEEAAEHFVMEIESLYTSGPSGGGGVRSWVQPTIRTYTAMLPRSEVIVTWTML